ncbi:MAG: dethiobiotin synthase [Gammaproteobacteria bacterium]
MSGGVFITGTDTGVGKSLFAAALLHRLAAAGVAAAGYKPVSAGCEPVDGRLVNEDAALLQAAAPVALPLETVNPVALEPAVAPHLAAADAGIRLSVRPLAEGFRAVAGQARFVVVEGAGGWRVPLNATETLADLARELALPVVLVVGLKLGCLNHALLSAEAVRRDGLTLAGWVANMADPAMPRLEGNIETLRRRLEAPLMARLPACPEATPGGRARRAARAIGGEALALLGAGPA